MTISGDTVCSVIQAFPVLLILAQNSNRCLKTPLIYHPPSPTHSPDYYEALDALFHTLHGHGHDSHDNHGCDDHNHGYQYYGNYGYGKKSEQKYYYNKPCHGGHKPHYVHTGHGQSPGYGHTGYGHGHNSHGYGHTSHAYGYPTYGLKGNKKHGQSGHDGTKVYAPNQVHNIKHKYKVVVVKANRKGNRKSASIKIQEETCTTVDNGVGSCLQVTECPLYLKLVQESRSNPNALRLLRQAHCGFQGTNPKVCCPRPGIPSEPPTSTTTTTEQAIVMPEEPQPSEEPTVPDPQPAPVVLPDPPMCGFSNASLSRVVGGVPAKLGDFPWMALLGYKERRAGAGARWLCGGSLISVRHVLTAAHCIHTREKDLYVVRLGELDLARDDEGATPVDVLIKAPIKHEEYNPKSFTNDIGILVLTRDVQYTELIKPICIPRTSELRARNYENYRPLIAGWGDTEFRGPSATHLQVLQLPVVTNAYCAQAYAAYKAQVIDARVLCAGYKQGKQDACQGDSGGPLMQPVQSTETRQTHFYQIGVVSYGKKCAEPGFPGVYTRVTNFVPWIEDTVARN